MFTKNTFLLIGALLVSSYSYADWDNPTLAGIADGGTYYTSYEPCALQISKSSRQAELIVTYTQNPVFWFPGFDGYRDAVGAWREANRCPRRDEVRAYYCPAHMKYCQTEEGADRIIELSDAGNLVESELTQNLQQNPKAVLHLYSSTIEQDIACQTQKRASDAAAHLTTVRDTSLDADCIKTFSDPDRGVNFSFYGATCVDRHTLGVYVANIRDRLFVDQIIALTAKSFEGPDARCLREAEQKLEGMGFLANSVDPKCAKAELTAAIDSLTEMAGEAQLVCDGGSN